MFTSAQVSSLVGGQQVMFSNQAQFAHQISGTMGTGSMPQLGGGQANPYPSPPSYGMEGWGGSASAGSRIAGGISQAPMGVLGGLSMAGAFMGGPLGALDPFRSVGGSFMRGAGGMKGLLGGGLRGGLGALGGGAMAAAGPAALLYAGYKGVEAVGSSMYEGVQNTAQVGNMAQQHFGSQFGTEGSRPGGKMSRQAIKSTVSVLEDLASDDMMVTMSSLKRLMDQAGQMGMLTGITNAEQFKQRFSGMVKQVKEIAQVMGTSLEEAAPMFGQMQNMGMWSATDVMGTAQMMKVAGPQAAPHMMQSMQAGAQMSHQMGGKLGAGAVAGRNMFMNLQAATRSGALSQQQLREFTGGVGGNEGLGMMSRDITGMMSQFSESPMGRLMMAGMGEFKEGKFTGNIDEGMLKKFMGGQVGVQQLQNIGQQRSSSRTGAVSYMQRKGQIGQSMMAQGGLEGFGAAMSAVMDKAGYGGADDVIQERFIQLMAGGNERTAQMMQKLMQELPRIREQKIRQLEDSMRDSAQKMDARMNKSYQGLKDAMSSQYDDAMRPVREAGSQLMTDIGEMTDKASDWWWGRKRTMKIGSGERQKILGQHGLGGGAGRGMMPEYDMESGTAEYVRNMNLGIPLPGTDILAGGIASMMDMDIGGKRQMVSDMSGIKKRWMKEGGELGAGEEVLLTGRGRQYVGQMAGFNQEAARAQMMRTGMTRSRAGFSGEETPDEKKHKATIQSAIQRMALSPDLQKKVKAAKAMTDRTGGNPEELIIEQVLRKMGPDVNDALDALGSQVTVGGGAQAGKDATVLGMVMTEAGWSETSIGLDYEKAVSGHASMSAASPEKAMEMFEGGIRDAAYAMTKSDWWGVAVKADEDHVKLVTDIMKDPDLGQGLIEMLKGDPNAPAGDNRFVQAAMRKGESSKEMKLLRSIQGMSAENRDEFLEGVKGAQGGRVGQVQAEARMDIQRMAGATATDVGRRGGELRGALGKQGFGQLQDLLSVYQSADFMEGGGVGRAQDLSKRLAATVGGDDKAMAALGGLGGIGAHVQALAGVGKLGGETIRGGAGAIEKRMGLGKGALRGMLDEEDFSKLVTGALGDKEFSGEEQEALKGRLTERLEKAGPAGMQKGRQQSADTLSQLLDTYTQHNKDFVHATGEAIRKMKDPLNIGGLFGGNSKSETDAKSTGSSQTVPAGSN